jgi:hypothetical protein
MSRSDASIKASAEPMLVRVSYQLLKFVRGCAYAALFSHLIFPLYRSAVLWLQQSDRVAFAILTCIIHSTLYFGINGLLLLADRHGWLDRFKIKRFEWNTPSEEVCFCQLMFVSVEIRSDDKSRTMPHHFVISFISIELMAAAHLLHCQDEPSRSSDCAAADGLFPRVALVSILWIALFAGGPDSIVSDTAVSVLRLPHVQRFLLLCDAPHDA